MPILGAGGRLVLKRQKILKTLTLDQSTLDSSCDRLGGAPSWIWNGDLIHAQDLPIYGTGSIPGRGDGFGTYFGSKWFFGPNRSQISNNTDKFYKSTSESYPTTKTGDQSNFYSKAEVSPVPVDSGANGNYWVHVDQAGYVSFYLSRCQALGGLSQDRVKLAPLYGNVKLSPIGTADYQNSGWDCKPGPCSGATSDYEYSNLTDSANDSDALCQHPPKEGTPPGTADYENANFSGSDFPEWEVIAGIREYTLEMSAKAVDTTSVSEKFGNAIKSFVNGGGNLEFFIDRSCTDATTNNSTMLMQLLMMTDKGCEADAEFWLMGDPHECGDNCSTSGGALFYKAKILITSTAINLRPEELVAGTADFVTTETIQLCEAG